MPTRKKSTYRFPLEGFLLGSPQEVVLEAKDGPLSCWEYMSTGCFAHPAISGVSAMGRSLCLAQLVCCPQGTSTVKKEYEDMVGYVHLHE